MRKSFYLFFIGCLLALPCYSQSSTHDFTTKQGEQLRVVLKPEKEIIMLGETTYVIFDVKNFSNTDFYTGIGLRADSNGRPTNFDVTVTCEDGKSVPQPQTLGMHGFGGLAEIPANGRYVVKLYLPDWATFEKTGTYSVKVKRNLGIKKKDDLASEEERFPVELSTKIKIVSTDNKKLGEIIDELGELMLDARNPEFADAANLLAFIEDPRVIKYHLQILEKYVPNVFDLDLTMDLSRLSVWALKKYNDDAVLETFKKLMNSPDQFMRGEVAKSLRDSPHPKALDLLLKMRNDGDFFVRLIVVTGLEKIKNDESTRLLREMLNDDDSWVREEAQKILEKRQQI